MQNTADVLLLPDLVTQVARTAPGAIAIESGGTQLRYADLDALSDRCAEALTRAGVGPGDTVGVSMTREPRLIVCLLGVMKAGAAYVPVDPALPEERRRFLVEDSGATRLLVDEDWRGNELVLAGAGEAAGAPRRYQVQPEDIAYLIYTSGSTGRPKGAEIPHSALANLIASVGTRPGLSARDRVLAHSTISFDIHVFEIWLSLAVGATVVLARQSDASDPVALTRLIGRARVTAVLATPAHWSMLLRAGWRDGAGMKALSGGETLSRDLAEAILRTGAELWNVYGPTETTVYCTLAHVTDSNAVVIGSPIPGATTYFLGEDLREVPDGEPGELCIGGAGLARGYRNRPELTRERFITFGPANERIYRSGDLARRRPDGTLDYLGRLDYQLKVAGHRIEPGEIEAALRELPGVRDAVVVGSHAGGVAHRLVAYAVTDRPIDPPAVRGALAKTLPSYMVPSLFVRLERLPMTSSGKVDRLALPPADWSRLGAAEPASTPTEAALVELWEEVLEVHAPGVTDDFFDLGGHSRLGAFLLALVAQRFGCTLPLPTIVEAPTIRQLARVIDRTTTAEAPRTAPVVELTSAGEGRPTLFLVHAAGGHAVIYNALGRALARDANVVVFQSRGFEASDDGSGRSAQAHVRPTVERLAEEYIRAIKVRQPEGPYAIGGASFGGLVAYEMARQLRKAGDQVPLLVMFDSELPRLGLSPLMRWLGRFGGFRESVYPTVRRAHAHLTAIARNGLSSYLTWMRRGGMDASIAPPAWVTRVSGSGEALLDGLARVRMDNERAFANFLPSSYEGPLLFCRARDVTPEPDDTREGWKLLCPRAVYRDVPGDHHTMMLPPQVEQLAVIVRQELGRLATGALEGASDLEPRPQQPTTLRSQVNMI